MDVSVYDSAGNIVASIVNDKGEDIGSSIISGIDDDGQKIIVLPNEAGYSIAITGREDDHVNYGISEYSAMAGEFTRDVNYFDVEIKKGEVLTGSIPSYTLSEIKNDTINGSTVEYTLLDNDGNKIDSDSDLHGEEVSNAYCNVNAIPSNNEWGVVSGAGLHQYGQYALVEAVARDGYEFIGWEQNGTIVSNESEYRLRVTEDVDLTAVFKEKASEENPVHTITFDANGGKVAPVSSTTKEDGTLEALPTPSRNGFAFVGWFDADGNEIVEGYVFEEDTTIYARWKKIEATLTPTSNSTTTISPKKANATTNNTPTSVNTTSSSANTGNIKSGSNPKTGDDNNPVIWFFALIISCGFIILLTRIRRQRDIV